MSGTDKVQVALSDFTTGTAANAFTAAKLGAAALAETAYFAYGTYANGTGLFTISESGPSTIFFTNELTPVVTSLQLPTTLSSSTPN